MGNSPPQATHIRDFDRSFILIGKSNSGKSTLGNLILGDPQKFEVHLIQEAKGLTKKVKSGETVVDPRNVYGENCPIREQLKIQVLDQPGCNDGDFTQENYCDFLKQCISESKGEMSATFLILVNLKSGYLSPEEFLTLMNIAEILSNSSYSFFPNTTVVFTHADKISENLNEEVLEEHLENKVQMEEFAYIKDLINLVEKRYIFINGVNNTAENRHRIIRKLFLKSRTNLNVYVNGNTGFKGNELKVLFREDPEANTFKKNLINYDVEYHFNPDLSLFRRYRTFDLHREISQALNKLSGISKGVSVMILLISLEEMFNKEIYNLIHDLANTYRLGEDFKKDYWNYSCIVFKTSVDQETFVSDNIEGNKVLKELVEKVRHRYSWVTEMTTQEECSQRILGLIRRVKYDTEGKTYIDSVVLSEMRSKIKTSIEQKKNTRKKQITIGITNEDLKRVGVPMYRLEATRQVLIANNDFFWDESISSQIGFYLLKNINPVIAQQFQERYQDPNQRISTQDYSAFCLESFKKM